MCKQAEAEFGQAHVMLEVRAEVEVRVDVVVKVWSLGGLSIKIKLIQSSNQVWVLV